MTPQTSAPEFIELLNYLKSKKNILPAKKDQATLLQERRLVLLVDLDHTILQTTYLNFEGDFEEGMFEFRCGRKSVTCKLRPHHKQFLESLSLKFELHVVTVAVKSYAKSVLKHLDPEGRFFGNRILTREDIPYDDKFAAMMMLFPNGYEHVVAIDDKRSVWGYMRNQYHIPKFRFFENLDYETFGSLSFKRKMKKPDDALLKAEKVLLEVHEKFFDFYDKNQTKSTAELFEEAKEKFEMVEVRNGTKKLKETTENTLNEDVDKGRTEEIELKPKRKAQRRLVEL
ncbi:hypothetical protein L596_009192 [Steinernema carpocapsae]|uniref:protein-serine/threonine phosphatase n=1 Tax=Steinernema carpocapsae TaxID=34508 RepID=A0A4U5PEM4_STECR|nr:hypothetical protein L596_009192 [Steinernema carpocapsae]